MAHPELQSIRRQLIQIDDHIANFKPLTARPPILDSSYEFTNEATDESQWLHQESVPGLKKLKESIKIDLGVLDKFLEGPNCANLPPLSTNAPYLLAVWNEVVSAPPPTVSVFKTFHLGQVEKARKRSEQGQAGVKVDVVADNGRRWIRVNTVKNSRILSEFREIDSYLTDSDDESADSQWDNEARPSLAQKEFDNSILRMGRALLRAAEANPIDGTSVVPRVTLRLTRLNPDANEDGTVPDPRIAQTVDMLRAMGVDVELGERPAVEPSLVARATSDPLPVTFLPTAHINLDLSVLIALISDLTHAALPRSIEEANRRFVPPQEYREWKMRRQVMTGKITNSSPPPQSIHDGTLENDINELPRDLITHARALTNQLLQEMSKGLLQELRDRIAASAHQGGVTFWTTAEARERCLRIVAKIGGSYEKRRARALFCLDPSNLSEEIPIPIADAQNAYWKDSRFPAGFIPLLPIQIYPTTAPAELAVDRLPSIARRPKSTFGASLSQVCTYILAQESAATPAPAAPMGGELQRAAVTRANARLTAHTVQSMRWGAELGWTTLTANRSSVKAILRELKAARVAGRLLPDDACEVDRETDRDGVAAIWIIDPRSLAEGMSSMPASDKA